MGVIIVQICFESRLGFVVFMVEITIIATILQMKDNVIITKLF